MGEIFRLEKPGKAMAFTGERFTSAESGQIEIEHVHRYFLARHFCRGKDVLDIASGEGYGAALLAQVAESVIGVDVAEEAVEHASRNYRRDRLSFRKGGAEQLPVPDASVDVVVSFETIEHLYDHDRFLAEIRRVLRPAGLLILSTPDRDIYSPPDQPSNPHHVHELTRREFYTLLRRYFPIARFFGQRAVLGSVILADEPLPRADLPVVFEQRGEAQAESSEGLARATYLICLASDAEIGPLPESLFIYSGSIHKIFRAVQDLHAALRREHDSTARLHDEIQTLIERGEQERKRAEQERITIQAAFKERDVTLSALELRLNKTEQDRAAVNAALEQTGRRLVQANQHRASLNAALQQDELRLFQAEQDRAALDSAVRQVASLRQNLSVAEAQGADLQQRASDLQKNYSGELRRLRRQNLVQFVRELPRKRARIRRMVQNVQVSPLFDPAWYLAQYSDVRERRLDPVLHYVRFGADEGRDPGPQFSTTFYIVTYPDILSTDYNPLEHYELFGRGEGRRTMPSASDEPAPHESQSAGAEHPDRRAAAAPEPAGAAESPPLPPAAAARIRRMTRTIRASPLFDPEWYVARYDDVRESGTDPALHYVSQGAAQGRDPGPRFSTSYYVETYPDVLTTDYNPLEHYELFGRAEGRQTTPARRGVHFAVARNLDASGLPAGAAPRVVFVSGEPHTPGHSYRVERYAEAARAIGAEVAVQTVPEAAADLSAIESADLVFIWRAEWNPAVEGVVTAARRAGAPILFDVDDLMFDPAFARVPVIDGIRSQGLTEDEVQGFYLRVQQTMQTAEFCSATTPFLTGHVRRWRKPSFVLPNGFDETTWRAARLAVRARRNQGSDGLLRLGYAGGSRTHQKDFAIVAGALTRILAERPECRLVLFRRESLNCLDLDEFPDLFRLSGQVEWRQLVPVHELPGELARFDINLAPLEVGNPFCESKSELKFFEAALAGVPTICSPTRCYEAAVRNGQTGILAETEDEWYEAMARLLDDPALRERMARAAYLDVLWPFGPEHRSEVMNSVLEQTLHRGRRAARAFELELARANAPRAPLPTIPETDSILHSDTEGSAEVTVIVPVHNYAHYLPDALDSVRDQTLPAIDLVVIDDCSTDDSLAVARAWIDRNLGRFNRALLLRNRTNAGLALTRNVGFGAAETPFVLQLDADNKLLADCALRCLEAIKATGAAFAYPTLRQFGDAEELFCEWPYDPAMLAGGNYIDATALVRLSAWAAVGGYDHVRFGWEDYDLWCRFAERGLYGHHVPEVLALYRVHGTSMLRTVTDIEENKRRLIADMRARHPWILEELHALAAE